MRTYLFYIVLVIGLLQGCSFIKTHAIKPNVVIVLTDDQGWGDVGFNGNKVISTPALDSMALRSVVFDRFYVSPVCAPTRASLLSGKYHLATGTSWVTHRKELMRESEITIAEILKAEGYKTAYFGKWHNGAQYPHNAIGQGFENFFGFSAGHINNYFNTALEYNGSTIQTHGYITNVLSDSVCSYIKNTSEPFLAYVAFNTPHTPYQVDDKYYTKYHNKGLDNKTATIYGMCENIDDNVRKIQNALLASGKYENTVFVFLSDNGPNYVRFNGGFKGRKAQVHEGGVRVPFFISYPNGQWQNRRIMNDFGAHIDLLPTILDICQIDKRNLHFDGISLKKQIEGTKTKSADRLFFSHQIISDKAQSSSVRNRQFLLTCYPNDTVLYNVLDDPFQMKAINKEHNMLIDSLIEQYNLWYKKVTVLGLEPEAVQLGHAKCSQIVLPAHEATLYGNVKYAGIAGWANDWAVDFNDFNDSMTWKINVVEASKYLVQLKYAAVNTDEGTKLKLAFGANTMVSTIKQAPLGKIVANNDRVQRAEVEERDWGTLNFGAINLEETNHTLNLCKEGINASGIQIKELVLNRIN